MKNWHSLARTLIVNPPVGLREGPSGKALRVARIDDRGVIGGVYLAHRAGRPRRHLCV